MGVLECVRIILYLIEWIWTTVILGIFPSQLKKTVLAEDDTTPVLLCRFNMNVGSSRCDFGVSFHRTALPPYGTTNKPLLCNSR